MAIESANVVGYQNKASRGGYNYIVPSFRLVSTGTLDIQDIQLDANVGALEANLQLLADNQASSAFYNWMDKATASDFGIDVASGRNGIWVLEDDELGFVAAPAVPLNVGDGVQIDAAEGVQVTLAGQVDDADLAYPARNGYNYVGNAFPEDIDMQNIQLDASVGALEANMQFLGSNQASIAFYNWMDKATAADFGIEVVEGMNGVWVLEDDELGFVAAPATPIPAAEGVQIDTVEGVTITVLSPIEL